MTSSLGHQGGRIISNISPRTSILPPIHHNKQTLENGCQGGAESLGMLNFIILVNMVEVNRLNQDLRIPAICGAKINKKLIPRYILLDYFIYNQTVFKFSKGMTHYILNR